MKIQTDTEERGRIKRITSLVLCSAVLASVILLALLFELTVDVGAVQ